MANNTVMTLANVDALLEQATHALAYALKNRPGSTDLAQQYLGSPVSAHGFEQQTLATLAPQAPNSVTTFRNIGGMASAPAPQASNG